MRSVGVKALKARLSEYLRLVKAGETVLVTERDEVVAEIRPSIHQPIAPSSLAEGLRRMAENGEATLASEDIRTWSGPTPQGSPGGSSSSILNFLRSDS